MSEYENLSGTYRGNSFTYKTIFVETAKKLLSTNTEFSSLTVIEDLYFDEINAACYVQQYFDPFGSYAAPMGIKHYEYVGSLPSKTLYLTVESREENKVISALIGTRRTNTSKITSYQTIYDQNRIVYSVENFGSGSTSRVVVAPINLYTSGYSILYRITPST